MCALFGNLQPTQALIGSLSRSRCLVDNKGLNKAIVNAVFMLIDLDNGVLIIASAIDRIIFYLLL